MRAELDVAADEDALGPLAVLLDDGLVEARVLLDSSASLSGVHRAVLSHSGWAGLFGPRKKSAKTIIDVR